MYIVCFNFLLIAILIYFACIRYIAALDPMYGPKVKVYGQFVIVC